MLQTNDIGNLFKFMHDAYGNRWTHGGDAIATWQDALKAFKAEDVFKAAKKCLKTYPEFPPTVGQFADMVEYHQPQLPPPNAGSETYDDPARAEQIYAYTKPLSPIQNPKGNPHHIRLPESIAQRKIGESIEQYEKRIADEVTFALYPNLRPRFESKS